jgi:hypothetical protein
VSLAALDYNLEIGGSIVFLCKDNFFIEIKTTVDIRFSICRAEFVGESNPHHNHTKKSCPPTGEQDFHTIINSYSPSGAGGFRAGVLPSL